MDTTPAAAETEEAPYWRGEILPEVRTATLDNGLRVTVVFGNPTRPS